MPDLRGHGDSDWAPGGGYEMFDSAADFAAVVDHLMAEGFKPPFKIIGHSFGGNLALSYAAAFPDQVERLIAIEGIGFSQETYDAITKKPYAERLRENEERRRKTLSRIPRRFQTEEEGISRMRALHTQLHADQADHLARHALRRQRDGFSWKHDPLIGGMPLRPVPPSEYAKTYTDIQCPVLLIYGKESWASSPKADGRLKAFKNAKFLEFAEAGHWLHHDQFDEFVRVAGVFLEEPA